MKIGPSFQSEIEAAGLLGAPFMWNEAGIYNDATVGKQHEALQSVLAAHDPERPMPAPALTSCTKLGLRRAFVEMGVWPKVRDFIAVDPDRQEEWDLATELKLTDPVMMDAIAAFAAEGIKIDPAQLVTRAHELVA